MTKPNGSARERLIAAKWDDRIQEEARIANDLQREHPGMARSDALRSAKAFLDKTERNHQ